MSRRVAILDREQTDGLSVRYSNGSQYMSRSAARASDLDREIEYAFGESTQRRRRVTLKQPYTSERH